MRSSICSIALTCTVSISLASAAELSADWTLSGYYKNLLTRSETFVPPGRQFTLDVNRLRLELEGRPSEHLALNLEYDNEVLLGNYLTTEQFALTQQQALDTRFDLDEQYARGSEFLARHRLYRATATWSTGKTDLTVGRQRIAWGTGRFWSPLDILNPLEPVRLEREERLGVDAVLLERKLGPLARVAVVHAPATDRSASATAAYLHGNARGTDYSVVLGDFRSDDVIGADFAGRVGELGVRGEATYTNPEGHPEYARVLLAVDYGLPNTLNVSAELYYNGQGASDPVRYDFASVLTGRVSNLARRYGGVFVSYEITPLLRVVAYGVENFDDESRVLWPSVTYSVTSNFDLSSGVQHFSGDPGSEYGRLSTLYYAEAHWFF